MSKKRNDKESMIFPNDETKPVSLSTVYKGEKYSERRVFGGKRGSGRLNETRKEDFLTDLATESQKNPSRSIKKHSN